MDAIIHNSIKKGARADRLVDFQAVNNKKYYFFFKQEPDRRVHKNTSDLSHAVPNKGMIYDYIHGKHYNTLREWAHANDCTLDDIYYGFNNQNHRLFVTLYQLLHFLDGTSKEEYAAYTQPPQVDTGRDNVANSIRDALQVIEYQMKRIDRLLTTL